jgi:hypothetical protein
MWKRLSCIVPLWEFECGSGSREALLCRSLNVETAVTLPSFMAV